MKLEILSLTSNDKYVVEWVNKPDIENDTNDVIWKSIREQVHSFLQNLTVPSDGWSLKVWLDPEDIERFRKTETKPHDFGLDAAKECYFSAGGMESDLGPRSESSWYWRRAARLWRERAEIAEKQIPPSII